MAGEERRLEELLASLVVFLEEVVGLVEEVDSTITTFSLHLLLLLLLLAMLHLIQR